MQVDLLYAKKQDCNKHTVRKTHKGSPQLKAVSKEDVLLPIL
jgi:hypothetical protein